MRPRHGAFLAGALLMGISPAFGQPSLSQGPERDSKPRHGSWGFQLDARDLATKPGDDFFRHANGAWFDRTTIDPGQSIAGVIIGLREEVVERVRALITAIGQDPGADASARQIGTLYASWMDSSRIEARGTTPLKPYLDEIAAIRSRADLLRMFAKPGFTAPIELRIMPDPMMPTRYIAFISQSGLSMPNRDYYLREGETYDAFRAAYREYVLNIQTLAHIADAEAKTDALIDLETQIARAHWTPERSRDLKQTYNPMDRAALAKVAPEFDWAAFLDGAGLGATDTVVIGQTTAISATGKMLEAVPLETWKAYLAYHFIRTHTPYLPSAFDAASFDFFEKKLRDIPRPRERWKRGVDFVNASLGEAVGRRYAGQNFTADSHRQVNELIDNLRGALTARLQQLDWMDEPTRLEALAKLAAFESRVGHPVKYIDYSSIRVRRDDLLGNAVRAATFDRELQLSRLPRPVDRTLWDMTPQTVNAYYNPFMNQITFPAAFLQPPYFDPYADAAVNYGGIGAIIGHEISHGFDDQGRQFDATGKMRDWWTPVSVDRFTAKTRRLRQQYDQFEPIPGVHVNGQLTMGENIGDLGGLEMAYAAYRRHVAKHGEPPILDGLTGDQRFFLAFAQAWRAKLREGQLRMQVLTNPHSPPMYRVNGIVRNMDAWYKAFNVEPGDALYLPPADRVHIW